MKLPGTLRRWRRAFRERRDFAMVQHVRPRLLGLRVEHVAGPSGVPLEPGQVLATCVVRNGESHVRPFVEHHLGLGVHHVVLLDNGSTDGTVEAARGLDRVTVLRTDAPYREFENTMKRYLVRRFCRGRWNLCLDIDERFDYPGSDAAALPALLRRLDGLGFTAVVAHMLDRFPDCELGELERIGRAPADDVHAFYDVAGVRRTDYLWGEPSNPEIRMYWGGIRSTLFGSEQGLTKAPLVRAADRVELFADWHHARGVRVADFTAVLLHFPFAGSFRAKVEDAVRTGRYGGISVTEYGRYRDGLVHAAERRFRQSTSRRWRGVDDLLDEGFLVASPEHLRWMAAMRASAAPAAEAARG